jgi:hypothetical protein
MSGVRFSNDGLTGWYGTMDAPAPLGEVASGRELVVVLGAKPAHPLNTATIRYAIDGGRPQTVVAHRRCSQAATGADYFEAALPALRPGQSITYEPTVACAGRCAPARGSAAPPTASAVAAGNEESSGKDAGQAAPRAGAVKASDRLPFSLEYLASIRVPLKQPETIGETPEGIKVNWYWSPAEGEVVGPALTAKVRHIGGDWMTIRRDGIGLMDVRATLETTDGALMYVSYHGYYELGPEGYHNFLARRWPMRAPTRTTPRFSTAHSKYLWLNRTQCLGIGEVTIGEAVAYTYDLYAVR